MPFTFDERPSDLDLVHTVWRTDSDRAGVFTSVAVSRWEMVVTRHRGRAIVTVRGPETRATRAPIPPDAEFFGIAFNHGAFMPQLPTSELVDEGINLPQAGRNSFWLDGRAWQLPTFENADTFLERLVRSGLIRLDEVVGEALHGRVARLSPRSQRRRVLRATGLTPRLIRQIERARRATALLQRGVSILDTVNETGYFDQPHLTRSLGRFVGHTPAEILRQDGSAEMSLSYKTREFSAVMPGPRTR